MLGALQDFADKIKQRVLEDLGDVIEEKVEATVESKLDELGRTNGQPTREVVENILDDIFEDMASDLEAPTPAPEGSDGETPGKEIGNPDIFTDHQKRVVYAVQRCCENGSPVVSYRTLQKMVDCGSSVVRDAVSKMIEHGWASREVGNEGTRYRMHKRFPEHIERGLEQKLSSMRVPA